MKLNAIVKALHALYLTNSFGLKLKRTSDALEKKSLRLAYAKRQLDALKIKVEVVNAEKIPK